MFRANFCPSSGAQDWGFFTTYGIVSCCCGRQWFGARQRGTACTVWRKLLDSVLRTWRWAKVCTKQVELILEINKDCYCCISLVSILPYLIVMFMHFFVMFKYSYCYVYVFLLLCLCILFVMFMYSYCYVYVFFLLCLCILIVMIMYSYCHVLCIFIVMFMYSYCHVLCIFIVMFMYSYCYICSVLYILFSSYQLALFGYPDWGFSVLFPQL